jgi:hypothetical protein
LDRFLANKDEGQIAKDMKGGILLLNAATRVARTMVLFGLFRCSREPAPSPHSFYKEEGRKARM